MTKPPQEKIDRGLECMISVILSKPPTKKYFTLLDRAIRDMEALGYEVNEYKEISRGLREEYLWQQEKN